jgi:serine protease AprX
MFQHANLKTLLISQLNYCIFACIILICMHHKRFLKHIHSVAILLILNSFTNSLFADSYYFFVQFSNKNNSTFSLENPSEYLSAKAIQRRNEQQIALDSTDLPVNAAYITQVVNQGVTVHSASKWINGVTVLTEDSSLMSLIRPLPFVKRVEYTGKKLTAQTVPSARTKRIDLDYENEFEYDFDYEYELEYGYAAAQTNQLKGSALHDSGYTGNGIIIGVLDAGFRNVDINPAFDSLRIQNRLLGVKNIIDPTVNVYQEDTHGANVLSIMAGNLPGQFVGVAPHASYWLLQTEYVPTEYMVEVDFWVRGLEFADSVGVDVVNSSLGYTEFDDASMNFTYADMNGLVSRASRAAYLASRKGIIVCTSAGNDGDKPWKYISSPADADGILTVGAVNTSGTIAAFSSFGPTADSRVKPEVCATGWGTVLINLNGDGTTGNGTSYSSPIVAGLTACYLQYCKDQLPMSYNVDLIIQHIISSSDRYDNPHEQYGYGLTDFQTVMHQTVTNSITEHQVEALFNMMYRTKTGEIRIVKNQRLGYSPITLQIFTPTGSLVHTQFLNQPYEIISVTHLKAGIYLVRVSHPSGSAVMKIVVH